MGKIKEAFIKCLPLIIVLVSTGLFALGVKLVADAFYAPEDTVYRDVGAEGLTVVLCRQGSANNYYIYADGYDAQPAKGTSAHDSAHRGAAPLAMFTLNEKALDMDATTVKTLIDGNGLYALQFGEFVAYKLEGKFGVFAPLRDVEGASTNARNDLYVVKQLLKDDRYAAFEGENIRAALEKLEWYLSDEK